MSKATSAVRVRISHWACRPMIPRVRRMRMRCEDGVVVGVVEVAGDARIDRDAAAAALELSHLAARGAVGVHRVAGVGDVAHLLARALAGGAAAGGEVHAPGPPIVQDTPAVWAEPDLAARG